MTILDAGSTISTTVADRASSLDSLLLNTDGLLELGSNCLRPARTAWSRAVNLLEPTTNLLLKYNPVFTCWLQGAKWRSTPAAYDAWGGKDGKSANFDVALLPGNDPYQYPDNLPIVAAKGGPGGKPGCGSMPDPAKNFPVRQLITNTGWGTGLDVRPNPGLGFPCWADWFPVTRAVRNRRASASACRTGTRSGHVPGHAALRSGAVRPRRGTALARGASGAAAGRRRAIRAPPTAGLRAVRGGRPRQLEPPPTP